MENYYAQLNEDGICITLSQTSGEIFGDNIIKLEEYEDVLGKLYKDGKWLSI